MLQIALYRPAIPQNTGNIGRLCVGMNARLHVISPGFSLTDKAVRRAGLDYWPSLKCTEHADDAAFLTWLGEARPWLVTKHGERRFDHADYARSDVLILGNENTGLPETWHERWAERRVYIPMHGPIRSYNLANAAAMVLSHATLTSE